MNSSMVYDFLVVGAGLFGATFAQLAKASGKKVLIIEKRPHIAGNCYTEKIESIHVHSYGAHIFHTNDESVWRYVNRFATFNSFINSPLANYKGMLYSLPFNMYTFNQLWGINTPQEAIEIIERQRSEFCGNPQNLEEQAISMVGSDVFETLIKGYTEKQWGRDCKDLPASIIKRIPVRFTFNNNYFDARYQGIPVEGYTRMIEKMLDGIDLKLNADYLKDKSYYDSIAKKVIYTGPIDIYFDYSLGCLEYREVRFEHKILDCPNFQGNAVINYTDKEVPWTRIIEHKWFNAGKTETGEEISKTVVSYEYSHSWTQGNEPYYPVNDQKNNQLYEQYKTLAKQERNVCFCGRLGEYAYKDMDETVKSAFLLFDKERL